MVPYRMSWVILWRSTHMYVLPDLTHWGRVTHICVVKLTIIASDNGLSPPSYKPIISGYSTINTKTVNTLRPRHNGRHFADDIFKCIFLNENVWIPIKISMNCVPKGPIDNNPALVQIMAWRRPGDKPLSEAMMVSLTTHHSASMS